MKKAYYIEENEKIRAIHKESYPQLMAALKYKNPKASNLAEDEELCQLHELLALVRLGHIRVVDLYDGLILLEIWEQGIRYPRNLKKRI